ncbi:MAG: hypothetical protein IJ373_03800 [Clostridia bacterium]|nr:hypothetical protein [Clostridia bacterium]
MKKLISLFLSVFLLLTVFCSCEVSRTGGNNNGGISSEGSVSDGSNDSEVEDVLNEESYTVSLAVNGKKFIPEGADMYAQWTKLTDTGDIAGFKKSTFNEDGIAFVNNLDGEYRITLGNIPDGYAYNPNLYVTSGNSRNIEVELYPIIHTTNSGSDLYENIIEIRQTGVYRVTIEKLYAVKEGVYFQFSIPRDGGVYSIQSLADVLQNTINPIAEIYNGSSAFKAWSHTCDDGVEFENGSYTKNFYFEGKASTDQGGFAIIPFAVRATSVDGVYPITVDILVSRKDDYPSTHEDAVLVYAKECPEENAPEGVGEWVGAQTRDPNTRVWSFDGDNYVYNEEDGFYHVGTKDGPYLYVTLDKPDWFLPEYYPPGSDVGYPVSFTTIEWIAPTAYLRVAQLDRETGERIEPKKMLHYKPMIEQDYAEVCNSDGRCLVTEELKWFLQELSESQNYFNDGFGWIETYSVDEFGYSISAREEDQWLFACGYYKQ